MSFKFLFRFSIMFIGLCLLIIRCASTGTLRGGDKDEDAPILIEEKSDKNFSINFSPEKIELVFNEWIELKNARQEVLISPPFFKRPEVRHRGKKVIVEFPKEEPLRPDVTYTINFGRSIVDFTEGNAVEDFRFVFATGDKIDSLTYSGNVVDAFGAEPVSNVLVLMYDLLADSVVTTEKPYYFARTGDDGSFKFENLKNDTFKILVLEDNDLNYLMAPETERIAFSDSLFVLNDSTEYSVEFRLFQPETSLKVSDSNSKVPGRIFARFNKPAEEISSSILYPNNLNPLIEYSLDTAYYWFTTPFDSAGLIFGADTLDFILRPFDSVFYDRKIRMASYNARKVNLAPFDSLDLLFNSPIGEIDTSLITLMDKPRPKKELKVDSIFMDTLVGKRLDTDSLKVDSLSNILNDQEPDSLSLKPVVPDSISSIVNDLEIFGLDTTDLSKDTAVIYTFSISNRIRNVFVNTQWKEAHEYQLTFYPGALTDIYGRSHDTLQLNFKTSSRDEYGNILLTVNGLDSMQQYVVVLRNEDKEIDRRIIQGRMDEILEFKRLSINAYNVFLIKDDNRDEKWTTGDYWSRRQPELLKKFDLEKIRENSDLESTISWEAVQDVIPLSGAVDTLSSPIDSLGRTQPILDTKQGDKKGNGKQ